MDQNTRPGWYGRRRTSDERLPLWRGRHPATPEKLRRQFELYVLDFERYIEERRAACL
jgi:hypothetical protein